MPAGRPSDYTPELAADICDRLMAGESMVAICLGDEYPSQTTIYRWLEENTEFRERYERARVWQAHTMADRAVEMATKGSRAIGDPQVAAVQLNAIKWAASKLAPKVYGDKQDINLGGQKDGEPVKSETVIRWQR